MTAIHRTTRPVRQVDGVSVALVTIICAVLVVTAVAFGQSLPTALAVGVVVLAGVTWSTRILPDSGRD